MPGRSDGGRQVMLSAEDAAIPRRSGRPIRWWICALLFASTVINYLDRQTLSLLAPNLKTLFHWNNTDYANLVIAFRVAYTLGQILCGRFIDKVGTRKGITIMVAWYSGVSMLTPLANGFLSFMGFRFMLGLGESANWPAATKAVSEWFPARERGLATAFFDSGSSLGGAVAPFLVFAIYSRWGWKPAFVVPGALGIMWLILWRLFYRLPEEHPSISHEDLGLILQDKQLSGSSAQAEHVPWTSLLRLRETWGVISSRALTDPVWFFIGDWFPIYLVSKGFDLRSSLMAIWVPFLAADAGGFAGGIVSDWLMKRGWALMRARKLVIAAGGLGTLLLIPTIGVTSLAMVTFLFGAATFSYAAFGVIANVLPSDLYQPQAVATVSGFAGAGAGIGTILAFKAVGYLSDARQATGGHAFDPIVVACGLVPFAGSLIAMTLLSKRRSASSALKAV